MKIAKVRPIYKGGDLNQPINYRPISVISILAKPIEKIIKSQIDEHLSTYNIINKNQYGFVDKSSTTSACIKVINEIQMSIDKKRFTACISLDLRKAFDSLQHCVLIQKLRNIGFSTNATNLIQNYLKSRYQFVSINKDSSDLQEVKCGVPQGSVLSPLLFNIYINDIFKILINGTLVMYADDAIITYSCTSVEELQSSMQSDLKNIENWLKMHHLKINTNKSFFVLFKSHNINEIILQIDNQRLHRKTTFKYLGLHINDDLKWNHHVDQLTKKLCPFIFVLYKLNNVVDKSVLYKIYFAHIHSKLIYMNNIWSSVAAYKLHELEVIQNKALKAIHKLPRLTPSNQLYTPSLLPMVQLGNFELIMIIHKMANNIIRHDVQLILNSEIHNINTRTADQIHRPRVHTSAASRGIMYNGITLYNSVPNEIKQLTSLIQFKKQVRKYLYNIYNPVRQVTSN